MNKRIVAAALWIYAGWTFGAMVAMSLGLSALLGPVMGASATVIFAGDPRRIIWTRRAEVRRRAD